MIKDFYTREKKSKNFNSNQLEVSDELSQLILKIENTLFTNKTEVLGVTDYGCNLNELIFSLVLNESVIERKINQQINAYCIVENNKFNVNTTVKFFKNEERDGALVDIYINKRKVLGALF